MVKHFKRVKNIRKIAKDRDGNIYLLYDNVIDKVPKGGNTGKFYCYVYSWRLGKRRLDLVEDWTDSYIPNSYKYNCIPDNTDTI